MKIKKFDLITEDWNENQEIIDADNNMAASLNKLGNAIRKERPELTGDFLILKKKVDIALAEFYEKWV